MSPALEIQKSLGEWRRCLLFAAASEQSTSFKLFPKMFNLALKIESSLGKLDQDVILNEFQFRKILANHGASRQFRDQFFTYLRTENTSSSQFLTRTDEISFWAYIRKASSHKVDFSKKLTDTIRGKIVKNLYLLKKHLNIKIELSDKPEVLLSTDNFPDSTILKLNVKRGLFFGDSIISAFLISGRKRFECEVKSDYNTLSWKLYQSKRLRFKKPNGFLKRIEYYDISM